MNKKLEEALKTIKIKCHPNSNPSPLVDDALKVVEQALQELQTIKNANPNEALEVLDKTITPLLEPVLARYEDDLSDIITANYFVLKQSLLKAQENEKEIAKYKQPEKDLGCPLDVVFKALQDGVYYEDVANNMRLLPVDLHFSLDGDYVLYFSDDECLLTKNYKKTWWLKENKEE